LVPQQSEISGGHVGSANFTLRRKRGKERSFLDETCRSRSWKEIVRHKRNRVQSRFDEISGGAKRLYCLRVQAWRKVGRQKSKCVKVLHPLSFKTSPSGVPVLTARVSLPAHPPYFSSFFFSYVRFFRQSVTNSPSPRPSSASCGWPRAP
jgi:hypothetical protein